MKNSIIAVLLVLLSSINSFSQSKRNDINLVISALPLIGKAGNYSGVNGFVIKPAIVYYINDRTSIGINFSYATMERLKVANIDSHYNSYVMVPTLRNNIINKEKFRMFADLGFGFGTIQYRPDNIRNYNYIHKELSGGISVFSIGIGVDYFFNDKFGLELLIPYIQTKNITSNSVNTIYSGVGPTIGFAYKL